MRKSLIAQSVATLIGALGLVAAANAAVVGPVAAGEITTADTESGTVRATTLVVNTDGIGHINIVPYFSTQSGNDTLINIVNTDTRNGKAVKVRFRGALNSDDIFDVTVLMSPGDVWAASVSKDPLSASGLPKLNHGDNSCTLPKVVKANFVTLRLDPALSATAKAEQASEGYVEILNMADIPPGSDLYDTIKHNASGVAECDAVILDTLFTDSIDYADARAKGLRVPTTGLMTNWTLINVPKASSYSGAATAVEARAGSAAGYGNIVLFPQAQTPVSVANARLFTSDPLLRGGMTDNSGVDGTPALPSTTTAAVAAAMYDFPDLSTPYLNLSLATLAAGNATRVQAGVLTRALAVTSVTNEFITDPNIGAKTDWVFSMPTRRYSVARSYAAASGAGANYFTNLAFDDIDGAAAPVNYFTPANVTTASSGTEKGKICITGIEVAGGSTAGSGNRTSGVTADREESFLASATEFVISPGEPAAPLTFCGEVSVLSFNAPPPAATVLGAKVAFKNIGDPLPYADGWVRLATPGIAGSGLPIVGAALTEFINNAIGAGAGYGNAFPHRATRP